MTKLSRIYEVLRKFPIFFFHTFNNFRLSQAMSFNIHVSSEMPTTTSMFVLCAIFCFFIEDQ